MHRPVLLLMGIFFCCLGLQDSWAQASGRSESEKKQFLDSLVNVLNSTDADTAQIILHNQIALEYHESDNEKALMYGQSALYFSEKINYQLGIVIAHGNIGKAYYHLGDYHKSSESLFKQLDLLSPDDHPRLADVYHALGNSISGVGDYLQAIDYYIKADNSYKVLNDTDGIADTQHNIGVIHFSMRSYDEALRHYFGVLEMVKGTRFEKDMGDTYNNIATVYVQLDELGKAVEYYNKALVLYVANNDEWGSAYSIHGLGEVYDDLEDYSEALRLLSKATKICEKYDDNYLLIHCYSSLGLVYARLGDFKAGLAYQKKAFVMATDLDQDENLIVAHDGYAEMYKLTGDFKKALYHSEISAAIDDSLLSAENAKQINELSTKYNTEKKENEIALLSKDNDLKNLAMNRQKIIIWSVGGGLFLVMGMALFIFRSYREKQEANQVLEVINAQVIEKNNKITQSINYARRIQKTILPPAALVKAHWPKSFILFKPKDIVSGDFYWSVERPELTLIAAVDCTGHGVPGAFMSMIGNRLLTEIATDESITTPAEALKYLHVGLSNAMRQDEEGEGSTDGLDIALCALNRKTLKMDYAGTHMPLYLIRNGELRETKPDKMVVGDRRFGDDFTNHTIQLEKGDVFYIFSDGYADQFGGPDRKKFYYLRFQELLLKNHKLSMDEQKAQLDKVIVEWTGEEDQIDDIMVIGVQI